MLHLFAEKGCQQCPGLLGWIWHRSALKSLWVVFETTFARGTSVSHFVLARREALDCVSSVPKRNIPFHVSCVGIASGLTHAPFHSKSPLWVSFWQSGDATVFAACNSGCSFSAFLSLFFALPFVRCRGTAACLATTALGYAVKAESCGSCFYLSR